MLAYCELVLSSSSKVSPNSGSNVTHSFSFSMSQILKALLKYGNADGSEVSEAVLEVSSTVSSKRKNADDVVGELTALSLIMMSRT